MGGLSLGELTTLKTGEKPSETAVQEMLEGIEHLPAMCLQLELLKRKRYYFDMANGIGNLWESPPKGASGA